MAQSQNLIVNLGYQQVHLEVAEKLGEGAFGTVSRVVDNRGVSFAVKHVVCHDRETYQSVAQEVEILIQVKHPNIVAMYGFEFVNYSAVLIMEFCSKGTLNKRLDKPVESMVQLQWMGQLTAALSYLHDSNIVHRDLKTENILLSDNDDVKIADFGISRPFLCCKQGRQVIDPNTFKINDYLDAFMGTFAGTPFWIAPEVFDNHYNEKADIFSLGIIFYAICERQFITFQNEKYYGSFINYKGFDTGIGLVMYEQQENIQPIFKSTKNAKLKAVILSMLRFCPDERETLSNVHIDINDAFFDNLEIEDTVANVGVSSGNIDKVDKVPKGRGRGTRLKSHVNVLQNVAITVECSMSTADKPRRKTRSASKKNGHQQVHEEKPKEPSNKKIPAKVSYKAFSEKIEDENRQKNKKAKEKSTASSEKVVNEKDKVENKSSTEAGWEKVSYKKSSTSNKTKIKKGTDKNKKDADGTGLVMGKRKKKTNLGTYV